jgi:hypothetical protein
MPGNVRLGQVRISLLMLSYVRQGYSKLGLVRTC